MIFSKKNILSLLISFAIFHACLSSELYNIEPIRQSSGIFYHNLGLAKLSSGYFTLLSYTNVTFYYHKLQFIKSFYDQSLSMCTKSISPKPWQEQLKFLTLQIPQLETKFSTVSNLVGHKDDKLIRNRRGLFNGVSYAFNWLFGTPDADDAQFYSDSIKNLLEQNHDVQLLMKQQIHIISSAIKNYNASAQSLKLNENKLNSNIKKFNKFSENTNAKIQSLELNQAITENMGFLSELINELNEEFDVLISSILFARQNTIHPSIITPVNLQKELLKVRLTTDAQFPISINNVYNIHKYFSICDLSVVYDRENIIYAIKIPLVHEQIYNLYNLIPLPTQLPDTNIYSYVDPSYPYLLLSTTKTHYCRLKNLSTCKKITEEDFLCSNSAIHLTTERPVCETILRVNSPSKIPEDCPTRTIKANLELWHPLSTNSWLFIVSKKTVASISCDKSNTNIRDADLSGMGILTLKPKCKCYTFSTVLYASSNRTSNYTNYVPSIDISMDDCCVRRHEYLKQDDILMEPMEINNLNLDELRHSEHKLEQFDEILNRNINQSFFSKHTSWFSTTLGASLITAIVLFLMCCCCNCAWLPVIGKYFPRRRKCCGFPNICITNNNERYEISDRQLMRLSRGRK